MSLHNSPRTFIVTGRPTPFMGLSPTSARSAHQTAPTKAKLSSQKRRPVFNAHFRHGQSNQQGPQRRGALDFGRAPNPCVPRRGWYVEQLSPLFIDLVPLSGSDLRECDSSLTCSVCDQIFTRPLHWPNATDLPSYPRVLRMRSTLVPVALVASAHSPHGTSMDMVSTLLSLERKARAMPSSIQYAG